ncbi:phosphatidylglycerophosphatase A [Carnobacterium sp. TMP28]|uniref:phosphatidylglycerophosphatase A family protein n=1 Tax=Carnobacterium sp. TMP28 TaxID=3397060 RepID=UPI0039DFBE73
MVKESEGLHQKALSLIKERGVELTDIADLVLFLQTPYIKGLTQEECLLNVEAVLSKREVQNTILTGIQLDILAEQNQLMEPLQSIISNDEGLYGIDEILALSIVNVYGSIGFTNYGYIDKIKPGILAKLNSHEGDNIHTFMDDIVGAIAAAAASRLAHANPSKSDLVK